MNRLIDIARRINTELGLLNGWQVSWVDLLPPAEKMAILNAPNWYV